MNWQAPEIWVAVLVGLVATGEDLWRRQISNWTSGAALAGGLACQAWAHGWRGVLDGVLGCVAGFIVFLTFYLLGGMGGGDVKLMAGFGALLGPGRLIEAALWTAGCGGLFAIGYLGWRSLRNWLRRQQGSPAVSIPYAPAITAGVWLSLVPKM
jgi:prepilin peptidase CpaA